MWMELFDLTFFLIIDLNKGFQNMSINVQKYFEWMKTVSLKISLGETYIIFINSHIPS